MRIAGIAGEELEVGNDGELIWLPPGGNPDLVLLPSGNSDLVLPLSGNSGLVCLPSACQGLEYLGCILWWGCT